MLQRAPPKYLHKLPSSHRNVPCHSLRLIAAPCSSTAFCMIPVSDFQLSPPPLANEEIPVLQHARKQNVVVNPQADIGQLSSARLSPPHFTKSEYDTDLPPVSYEFIESTPLGRKKKKKRVLASYKHVYQKIHTLLSQLPNPQKTMPLPVLVSQHQQHEIFFFLPFVHCSAAVSAKSSYPCIVMIPLLYHWVVVNESNKK